MAEKGFMNVAEDQPRAKRADPQDANVTPLHALHIHSAPQIEDQPTRRQLVYSISERDEPQGPTAMGVKNYSEWAKYSPQPEGWGIND